MIIHRYLVREIRRPLVAVLGILIALFAGFSTATLLSDAVNGLLPTEAIAQLIGLKLLISLEVLIPISLYISVVLAFGKLYGDSEFTAMYALHVTPGLVLRSVLKLSLILAAVVMLLSLFVRPWAYEKSHDISRRAQASLNVDSMEAGTFYISQHGNRVIFFPRRDGLGSPAQQLFVQIQHPDSTEIISAKAAVSLPPKPTGGSDVALQDARIYSLARDGGTSDRMLEASSVTINPDSPDASAPEYSATGIDSFHLALSHQPADIAEFQWRLSTPLSTLLLGMLGVPLSRVSPRQEGRYAKFGTAILVYSGYYLLCTSARTWVQHGSIGAFPGIWWAPGLLALLLFSTLYWPEWNVEFHVKALIRRTFGLPDPGLSTPDHTTVSGHDRT